MDALIAPTKDDLKLLAKRELRQKQESYRKERIFNARTRVIGVDKLALDKIVSDKQQRELNQRNEDFCFAKELQRKCDEIDSQLRGLNIEAVRQKSELNEFRLNRQRKEQTRDFDLNDPNCLKKISPNQGFEWLGEDESHSHRQFLQKQQQKSWLKQQIDERNQTKEDIVRAEQDAEQMMHVHQQRLKEIDESEKRSRRQIQRETALYNLELARKQKSKQIDAKRETEEDNLAEIVNNLTSDMLLETKETALTSNLLGSQRICVDMYRGMTDEQVQAIRLEQRHQIDEKQRKLAEEKEHSARFNESVQIRCKILSFEEEEKRQQRHQIQFEQNAVNARLMQEQKQRNDYLNKEVYAFTPTEEYFEQFNTTTR